jgi:hypothetical protein
MKKQKSANVHGKAYRIGTIAGRPVYRIPVRVACNDSRKLATVAEYFYRVIAYSAAGAANYIRDQFATRPETEVFAYGPQGGETYRYVGWESAIGSAMFDRPRSSMRLPFEVAE